MLLISCIDVQDYIEVRGDGKTLWSLHLQASDDVPILVGLDSFPRTQGVQVDSFANTVVSGRRHLHFQVVLDSNQRFGSLDSLAWFGPLRQSVSVAKDSAGNIVWERSVRIVRDPANEDGAFADRMQASIYRGLVWRFSAHFPGPIMELEPQPTSIDTASGTVQWVVPVVQLIQGQVKFRSIYTPPAPEIERSVIPLLVLCFGAFFCLVLLIWIRKRYRRGKLKKTIDL